MVIRTGCLAVVARPAASSRPPTAEDAATGALTLRPAYRAHAACIDERPLRCVVAEQQRPDPMAAAFWITPALTICTPLSRWPRMTAAFRILNFLHYEGFSL
jgi:hypothetical protein